MKRIALCRWFKVGDVFFDNKIEAKTERDRTGQPLELGPDHWRYRERSQ